MRYLDADGSYVSVTDLVSWLIAFAEELDQGNFGDDNGRSQVIWNIVSSLIADDFKRDGGALA